MIWFASFPNDTLLNFRLSTLVRSLNDLQRKKPEEAIAALEPARKYEMGVGPWQPSGVLAGLCSRTGLPSHAGPASSLLPSSRKILDHRGALTTSELYPLAQLNLARAYKLSRRYNQGAHRLSRLLRALERRRSDIPVPHRRKSRVRQAEVTGRNW